MAPPTSGDLGAEDSKLSKCLRLYGRGIGRHPQKWAISTCVISWVLIIVGLCTRQQFGGSQPLTSPLSFSRQWSVKGGQTEATIALVESRQETDGRWSKANSITMFVPKPGQNKDLGTRAAMLEMYTLFVKLNELKAEVNGTEYTFWDVCDRGILPDLPASMLPPKGSPILPCGVVSPFMCFAEGGDINHQMYRMIDAMFGDNLKTQVPKAVPFSTRPSFKNLSDDEIKANLGKLRDPSKKDMDPSVGRGCFGWNDAFTFYVDLWGGRAAWDENKTLTSIGAVRFLIYFDGDARIKYRLQLTKPELAEDEDHIGEAVAQMSHQWHDIVKEFAKTTEYVEVADLEDLSRFSQVESALSKANGGTILGSFILMVIFVICQLSSFTHPMASRALIGLIGLCFVVFAEITALGLYFICNLHLNPVLVIAMPLLGLGLGCDDMFMLIRCFSDQGYEFLSTHTSEEIMGQVFAEAGPGTTLSSVCNIITFGIGAAFPIPAMADFCLGAVFISAANYLIVTNLFLPLLVSEVYRIQNRQPENCPCTYLCHRRAFKVAERSGRASITATHSGEYDFGLEKGVVSVLRKKYAPLMMQPVVRLVTLLVALVMLIVALALIRGKELGYGPWDLFQKNSMENRAMELVFTAFSIFPARVIFQGVDVASNQAEMLELMSHVYKSQYVVPGATPTYLTALTLLGSETGGMLCVPPKMLADPNATIPPTMIMCDRTYIHPQLAPLGLVPADKFDAEFQRWRQIPAASPFAWAKTGFMYADMVGAQKFDYLTTEDGKQKITFSSMDYMYRFPWVEGKNNEVLFLDAIQHTKDQIEASPLKGNAVAYGSTIVFWEVFLDLAKRLNSLIGIGLLVILGVTLVMSSFDIPVAIITTLCCALIVLEVYGIAAFFINFNIFVASLVLFGLGMAVEFTAHFAMAFNLKAGHDNHVERLADAIAHTFPATYEGSVSTLVSIIPLAFANNAFTVKYLFGVIALVVAIGLFNGLLIMPGLMALFSPIIRFLERKCGRKVSLKKDVEDGGADAEAQGQGQAPAAPSALPQAPVQMQQPGALDRRAPPSSAQERKSKPEAAKQSAKPVTSEDTDTEPLAAAAPPVPPKEADTGASSGSAAKKAPKEAAEGNGASAETSLGVVRQVGDRLKCSL